MREAKSRAPAALSKWKPVVSPPMGVKHTALPLQKGAATWTSPSALTDTMGASCRHMVWARRTEPKTKMRELEHAEQHCECRACVGVARVVGQAGLWSAAVPSFGSSTRCPSHGVPPIALLVRVTVQPPIQAATEQLLTGMLLGRHGPPTLPALAGSCRHTSPTPLSADEAQ